MIKKDWFTDSFLFKYKNKEYIVLIKRYEKGKKTNKYALVELEFMEKDNIKHNLKTPANVSELMVDDKDIKQYFNIERSYRGNGLKQLYESLGMSIPTIKKEVITDIEQEIMISLLAMNDSKNRDPNRIHCYAVQRNPIRDDGTYKTRSGYNNDLAKLTRKTLYDRLECHKDKHISFRFSTDQNDWKDDKDIIYNFTKNREKSR